MNGDGWVSLIALAAWLVLALSAWRAHQVNARKTITLALTWAAIFTLTAAIFVAAGQ